MFFKSFTYGRQHCFKKSHNLHVRDVTLVVRYTKTRQFLYHFQKHNQFLKVKKSLGRIKEILVLCLCYGLCLSKSGGGRNSSLLKLFTAFARRIILNCPWIHNGKQKAQEFQCQIKESTSLKAMISIPKA